VKRAWGTLKTQLCCNNRKYATKLRYIPIFNYCNQVALSPMKNSWTPVLRAGVLAWPAWWRVVALSPALAVLWWGVAWASQEVAPL
jgi:hypothetical protein